MTGGMAPSGCYLDAYASPVLFGRTTIACWRPSLRMTPEVLPLCTGGEIRTLANGVGDHSAQPALTHLSCLVLCRRESARDHPLYGFLETPCWLSASLPL